MTTVAVSIERVRDRSGRDPVRWPELWPVAGLPAEPATVPASDARQIVAGLAPGSRVATIRGLRRIEVLEPGDRVITRDNGFVPVIAVQRQRAAAADVVTLRVVGQRGPDREIRLGRGHGVLWTGAGVEEALGTREGFLRACEIAQDAGETVAEGFVTLFLPVLARQEVIYAEAVAVASALPEGSGPARRIMTQDEARRVLRGHSGAGRFLP